MAKDYKNFISGTAIEPKAVSESTLPGEMEVLTIDKFLRYCDGVTNYTVLFNSAVQTITNKTIAAGSNTITGLTNTNLSGSAAITNANLASMNTLTIKGNNTGGSSTPLDLTVAQVNTMLGISNVPTSIGALDAQAENANGLALVSNILSAQSADATHPGMVNITTQTFTGQKTFATGLTGTLTGSASLNLLKTNNLSDVATPNTAFNNISPMTTGGDIIYGGTSGAATRLANGSATQVLTSQGTTLAPKWGNLTLINSVVTKTTTYPITNADYTILCDGTSAAFTVTLPTAVGISGQVFVIKKIDSTFNQLTIATTSSQTIDGITTTQLSTQFEAITLQSDGTNWEILDRRCLSNWKSFNQTVGAVTTPPTGGSGNVQQARWRRVGDSIEIIFYYAQTNSGSGGSGIYLFPIPSGLTIDTTIVVADTGTLGALATILGTGHMGESDTSGTAGMKPVMVTAYDSTHLRLATVPNGTVTQPWSSGQSNSYADPTLIYSYEARVPIVGWNA